MSEKHAFLPTPALTSTLWREADLWRLWSWCFFSAARKSRQIELQGLPVFLNAGEIAAPLSAILAGTGLAEEKARKALAKGKTLGLWEVRPTPWWLRIVIVNWHNIARQKPSPPAGTERMAGQKARGKK